MKISNKTLAVLLFIATFISGATWPLARWMVGSEFGATIPPLMIALIRYFLVIISFILLLYITENSLDVTTFKRDWLLISVMGFLSVPFYQAVFLFGEVYTSGSDASLIMATVPIFVLFSAIILLKESISTLKMVGTLLAFLGVLIIVGLSPNTNVQDRLLGDFLIFLGAIALAIETVLVRFYFNKFEESEKPSSLFLITWVSVTGFIMTMPLAFFLSPEYLSIEAYFQIPFRIWIGILYFAFLATLYSFLIFTEAINKLGATSSAIFLNFLPVWGVGLSAIFLNEIIDPVVHALSFILILGGVALVNRSQQHNVTEVDNLS